MACSLCAHFFKLNWFACEFPSCIVRYTRTLQSNVSYYCFLFFQNVLFSLRFAWTIPTRLILFCNGLFQCVCSLDLSSQPKRNLFNFNILIPHTHNLESPWWTLIQNNYMHIAFATHRSYIRIENIQTSNQESIQHVRKWNKSFPNAKKIKKHIFNFSPALFLFFINILFSRSAFLLLYFLTWFHTIALPIESVKCCKYVHTTKAK